MLNNEITFTELETGEEYYINEYSGLKAYGDEEFDPGKYCYYLFDMDGDDTPELCIWDGETYIFKYYSDFGEMALWLEIPSPNEQIHGTKVLDWNWAEVTSAEIDNSLIDWTWTETAEENEEARHKSYGRMDVSVERMSRMITNGEGEILAEVYYDRPVVSENSWAARRINQFFEQEELWKNL